MKTFSITNMALGLVAMMAVLSCSNDDIVAPGVIDDEPAVTLPNVITAEVEGTNTTRATIINYKPVWRVNDEICVSGVKYKCTNAETGAFEKVAGEGNGDGTTTCCYPYSLYQNKDKFCLPYEYQQHSDIDFMPMIGIYDEATQKVTFKNLGAVCRFRIKNTHAEQTVYAKSLIITPSFQDGASKTTNGMFTVSYPSQEDKTPQIVWDYTGDATHQPFMVIHFDGVKTLAPGAYHDVYAFLPPYDYTDLNLRTEAYLNAECTGQVYFSSIDKGAATVERNNWYDIAVKAGVWNPGVRGNGTPEHPFELGSANDITYINNQIKSQDQYSKDYFKQAVYTLTQDITITDDWNQTIGGSVELQGVGVFSGVFDGQGHKFTVVNGKKGYRPLFWDVDGAVIKNLIVEGEFYNDDNFGTFSPFFYSALSTSMVACVFNGTVSSSDEDYEVYVFGAMNAGSYLAGCAYSGSATDGLHAGVYVDNDNTAIPNDHITIYPSAEGNVQSLNTALNTWNNSTADKRAKTDYRYQWQDGKLVLTKAN